MFDEVPNRRPQDLSRFTVDNDRWDRETVNKLLDEIKQFDAFRDKLVDSGAGEVARPVWQDLWLALWKGQPEMLDPSEVQPTHQVNHMVMEEAQGLQDYHNLRVWTQGDDVGSALACINMEPEIETLYDRAAEAQKRSNELADAMQALADKQDEQRDIDDIFKDWSEDHDPDEPENQEQASDFAEQQGSIQEALDELAEAMATKQQSLQQALDNLRGSTQATLSEALQRATEEAKEMAEACNMWSDDPGTLHRLPHQRRVDLAKRMNTEKFRKFAELVGPMESYTTLQQMRKVDYMREEVVDIEAGNDLARVLPERLVQMADPDEEDLFWADYAEAKLPQYAMIGKERVAKGGIVFCHDGSGSMSGDKEMWAKAVGLCLLHVARKSKPMRSFWGIQFGGRGAIRIDDFHDLSVIEPEAIIDFAEFFFNGGTDFMGPLDKAIEILMEEHERTGGIQSDIVFATDGQCSVTPEWMKKFRDAQEKLKFRCWGINIGGSKTDQPMFDICNGVVCTIKDLTNGEDVKEIFGGI